MVIILTGVFMAEYIYIDGKFYTKDNAKISVYDHGLLYGDGVFEGIRAYNGTRFQAGRAHRPDVRRRQDHHAQPARHKEKMKEIIMETLRKNNLKDAYIRPIITRGKGDLGLDPNKCPKATIICIAETWGAMYGDLYDKGLTAITVSVRRNAPEALPTNIKSLNYLNNILAKIEANVKGGNEAIIFDIRGNLSEGSGDNIFLVKNGEIRTPFIQINLKASPGAPYSTWQKAEDTHGRG